MVGVGSFGAGPGILYVGKKDVPNCNEEKRSRKLFQHTTKEAEKNTSISDEYLPYLSVTYFLLVFHHIEIPCVERVSSSPTRRVMCLVGGASKGRKSFCCC